jgi:carbon-monoxide dehydrogenase medium subunit
LEEAIGLLQEKSGAIPLAGGHSLLVEMKLGRRSPAALIDLRKIEALYGIRRGEHGVSIGAMVTHAQIANDEGVRNVCPALADAVDRIADPEVRNRATIGGSLARNDPAADVPAVALALNARIEVAGSAGTRWVAVDDFFTGPFEVALGADDIITQVSFSGSPGAVGSAYEKFRNPASGLAICGVGVAMRLAADGTSEDCRAAATGVSNRAIRLFAVEKACTGLVPIAESIAHAAAHCGEGVEFVSDLFASAAYRAHLCRLLTERALNRAQKRAAGT